MYLDNLKQQAIQAHYGTSFSPEKRGENLITEFEAILINDLEKIKDATSEQKELYISKFKSLLSAWISAKSRCLSTMIAGPSNFPVRRAEKANRSEHNRYEIFQYWREKALKGIIKSTLPEKTFQTEIERYKSELEGMKRNHELMKEGNKRIKEALKTGANIDKYLIETFDIKPHMLDWAMKFGFGLQNNNANIKRVEQRIKELEVKETIKDNENKEIAFDGGLIIFNYSIDRIQIKHNSKPDKIVIDNLKKNAFKWSPSQMVWQRQLTNNAIYAVKHFMNIKFQ